MTAIHIIIFIILLLLFLLIILYSYKKEFKNVHETKKEVKNMPDKKLNIAVLIYGRLNKCTEHYDNIIDSIGRHNNVDFFLSSDNSSQSLLDDFIRVYKPIKYINKPIYYNCDITKYPNRRPETLDTTIHNMVCHYINKLRVFALLDEYMIQLNRTYDVVLSLRVDCFFHNSFPFDNLVENTIYIPEGYDYGEKCINDQIAYGKVDVMRKYNSIFLNIIYFLDNNISIPHSESLHYANIQYHNLQVSRPDIKYYLDK